MDEELEGNGGTMPWKRLRSSEHGWRAFFSCQLVWFVAAGERLSVMLTNAELTHSGLMSDELALI